MKDDEADHERRRLTTLSLVEAFEKLIEEDQRSDLKWAREFVVGALLVSCSPKYREIVRTPGSDLETGELDGELLLGAGVGALWAIMMLGGVACGEADDMIQAAAEAAHEKHHQAIEAKKKRRSEPSEN